MDFLIIDYKKMKNRWILEQVGFTVLLVKSHIFAGIEHF